MESDKEEARFARETLRSLFHPNGPRHILIELACCLSFHALWVLVVAGVISPSDVELLLFFKPRMTEIAMKTVNRYGNMPLKHRIALLHDYGQYYPLASLTVRGSNVDWSSDYIIRRTKWCGMIPARVFVSLLDPRHTIRENLAWRPPNPKEILDVDIKRCIFHTSDWTLIRDAIPYICEWRCIYLSTQLQRCGRSEVARLVRSALRTKEIDPQQLFNYFVSICEEGCAKTFAVLWGLVRDKRTFFSKGVALGYTPQQCVAPPLSASSSYHTLTKNDILCIACKNHHQDGGVELVEYLLDNVCPPGRFYECQLYPLRAACSAGNETLVRYLMERFVAGDNKIAEWGDAARYCLKLYWHPCPEGRKEMGSRGWKNHPKVWCDYSESWDGMRYPLASITAADPSPDVVDAAIAELSAAS